MSIYIHGEKVIISDIPGEVHCVSLWDEICSTEAVRHAFIHIQGSLYHVHGRWG